MPEESKNEEKKERPLWRKILSYAFDGLLVAAIGFLIFMQISMAQSAKKNPDGIRYFLDTTSFHVDTDSMQGTLNIGDGIVVKKVSWESLKPASYIEEDGTIVPLGKVEDDASRPDEYKHFDQYGNPIFKKFKEKQVYLEEVKDGDGNVIHSIGDDILDENGKPIYILKGAHIKYGGDIITFRDYIGVSSITHTNVYGPITHRLVEISKDNDGVTHYYAFGDNAKAGWYKDMEEGISWAQYATSRNDIVKNGYIPESAGGAQFYLYGKVISDSAFLGWFIHASQQAWFIPVVVAIPIIAIIIDSVVKFIIKDKKEEALERIQITADMEKEGLDPNDPEVREKFEEKWYYKKEFREKLEKEKEEQKKEYRRIFEKEKKKMMAEAKKKNGQGESEYERIKREEKERILREMRENGGKDNG